MDFKIVRESIQTANPTEGRLLAGDLALRTLELPWKDNYPGVSCVPQGTYQVVIAFSNRFQRLMPRLVNVPNRSGILIHPGNTPHDTEGCILVGISEGPDGMLVNSRMAFDMFFPWLGIAARDGTVNLEISYA